MKSLFSFFPSDSFVSLVSQTASIDHRVNWTRLLTKSVSCTIILGNFFLWSPPSFFFSCRQTFITVVHSKCVCAVDPTLCKRTPVWNTLQERLIFPADGGSRKTAELGFFSFSPFIFWTIKIFSGVCKPEKFGVTGNVFTNIVP